MEFSNENYWKKEFGLLPIKLDANKLENKYILMNGGNGDFCFQNSISDLDNLYNFSWSTGTKNFLSVGEEDIYLHNWYYKKYDKIKKSEASNNVKKLYEYILSKSFKTENDVVPFILNIFNQLRNLTIEKENPVNAINLLFRLLVSLENENYENPEPIWSLDEIDLPENFEYFVDEIRNGVTNVKPNLDLILRHSSGPLFQVANQEVYLFDSQTNLFGGTSSKLGLKNVNYSSVHYTPQFLARTIVENCLNSIDLKSKKVIKIFDPCCGSAEFLIESLKQLKTKNFTGKIIIKGYDKSISAIKTAEFILKYENRTQWDNKLEINLKLVNDSLIENWEKDNDIILMNPPFTSWELIKDSKTKEIIESILENLLVKKRPNQSSAFFYKAVNSLNIDGLIGCVLPSSIFTSDSYKKLRNRIEEQIEFKTIAKLGNFVFNDAITDISFFVGHNKINNFNLPTLIWTRNIKGVVQTTLKDFRIYNYNNEVTKSSSDYSIYKPTKFPINQDNWKILSSTQQKFIESVELNLKNKNLITIDKLFTINQGILAGVKNIFKISLSFFDSLNFDEKKYFRPVVTNNSIKNGLIEISQYIWYPYDENGTFIENEEQISNLAFYKEILFPNKEKLINRKGIKNWWDLTRPRNWQYKNNPRIYSTRFGNSSSFSYSNNENYVIEEGNAFIPTSNFKESDFLFFLAIFCSDSFDNLLSVYSRELAGGKWYDLGARQIRNIPVPNILNKEFRNSEIYFQISNLGSEISKGNFYVKSQIDRLLNTFIYPLYD